MLDYLLCSKDGAKGKVKFCRLTIPKCIHSYRYFSQDLPNLDKEHGSIMLESLPFTL